MEEETYLVPEEIDNLLSEAKGMANLRDIYAKIPFGYKKAVKAAKESEIKRRLFWQKLYALYPKLSTEAGYWKYHPYTRIIKREDR